MAAKKIDISIIIPTYNRRALLLETLRAYKDQDYPSNKFEIVVADDGSTDGTGEAVASLNNEVPYRLTYIRQDKKGPAAARNKAMDCAEADILLFTGDDISPKGDLIRNHLDAHGRYADSAILGFVDWSARCDVTDFMRYVAPDGPQFRYASITDIADCGFRHFYTSNISIGKRWFSEDRFDEEFPYGALEDTELAYRLEKKGLKIVLNRDAVGFHYHPMDLRSFCRRMKLTGISASIILRKHPELRPIFLPINGRLADLVGKLLKNMTFIEKLSERHYWHSQLVAAYIEGVTEGRGF